MNINIPELALVVLVGPSGSGKSTFARTHFKATEIVSSDVCRGMVSDDENNQAVTSDAFELVHFIIRQRLKLGKLTVVDATNVQPEARKPLVAIAREFHALPVAIVFNTPERICGERNTVRPDRDFGHHVIRKQISQMKRGLRHLKREGFRYHYTIEDEETATTAVIERQPLWNNKRDERGPFDIIGDVHGCCDELEELLAKLGYEKQEDAYRHPAGRKAVFVGDLVDRGPRSLDTVRLVKDMVEAGSGYCVPGNHDVKFLRWLIGKKVQVTHGLETTIKELETLAEADKTHDADLRESLKAFIDGLVSHYVFDNGKLVVAHAGMKESMIGRGSGAVRSFALYGETTGETDEFGLPIRHNWAAEYRGDAMVVYGHTPVPEPDWLNRTINIDTGCVFGGKLTALHYPELETVSVPAKQVYAQPRKPFLEVDPSDPSAQQQIDGMLEIEDVTGKRIISTRLRPNISIREENANAALEIMSRFAVNPKWLIYLPPTMSPCETSQQADYLEYAEDAFAYFRTNGVHQVICEEKHMGSRAIVVICRDEAAAEKRFGVSGEGNGIIYTRTGRRFIADDSMHHELLARIHAALSQAGFWDEFQSNWFCLDCELMPWSWKAKELLERQYAAAGSAGLAYMTAAESALASTTLDGLDELRRRISERRENIAQYIEAYRQYCWDAESIADLKLAPFHLMASEGKVHLNRSNEWHMTTLERLCKSDPEVLLATNTKTVDVTDEASVAGGCQWWLDFTTAGGEGMVIKPMDFIAIGSRDILQPAIKCRGREYLRIIYGPEYTQPENLERLRNRGLRGKRSLALREFALGIEALERFVRRDPLRRVHECVFGVLALESEPVDPRL